jgi:hypothetical protein
VNFQDVAVWLESHGLILVGGFHPEPDDVVPGEAGTVLIVGNVGSAIYPHLAASPEFGQPQPLDRWTRRVLGELAQDLGADILFPFDGPPWQPFQRWAMRADPNLRPSPIGMLIHPVHGLWHGLRGALVLRHRLDLPMVEPRPSPCAGCTAKPCLHTCPVDAFKPGAYDVRACRTFLGTLSGQDCMMLGCRARRACPVGRAAAYPPAQAAFHMRAFR